MRLGRCVQQPLLSEDPGDTKAPPREPRSKSDAHPPRVGPVPFVRQFVRPWDEIPDPHALDLTCTVSGRTLQSSNTRHLIFTVPEIVAYLSGIMTLEPGDVIATGTPPGVGFAQDPPRFLQHGDTVECAVSGIGTLSNPVVDEAAA